MKRNIRHELKEIFVSCSLMDESEELNEEIEKMNMEIDSFTYISVLLEIEDRFEIEIPEEYLGVNLLGSVSELCKIIESLLS